MRKQVPILVENKTNDETEIIQKISLGEIEPHPGNRKVGGCDKRKLKELANSIKAIGVQQPIILRRKPGFMPGNKVIYQIVAGERRWRASGQAKQKTVPAIIREISDDELIEIQFVENIQREDVHPLDESENYVRMIRTGRYTAKLLADKVGKSITYVTQRIQLSKLTKACKQAYIEDKIHLTYAFEISRLQAAEQDETLEYVLRNKNWMTLQELRSHITRSFLDLTDAPFPLDSDLGNSDIPVCDGCQERTGINRDLFSDLKKDQCTNSQCFNNKVSIFIKKYIAEFPDLPQLSENDFYMRKWLEWDTEWDDPEYKPFANKKIPDKNDYKECIIIDSNIKNRKGKIVLAKINDSMQEEPEPSASFSSFEQEDSNQDFYKEHTISAKSYQIVRKALFTKIIGKLNIVNLKTINRLIPIILEFLKKNKNGLELSFEQYKCAKPDDFRAKLTEITSIDELLQLCLALLIETVIPSDYTRFPDSPFQEMATGLKIDIEKIQTDARQKVTDTYNRKHKSEDTDEEEEE